MSWYFEANKIPSNVAIHKFIFENTDFYEKIKMFKNYPITSFQEVKYKGVFQDLKNSVEEGLTKFGVFPFQYKDGKLNDAYLSSSLTYNSLAIDSVSENVHQATLGSSIMRGGSYSTNEDFFKRNTYNDTLSFKERTPLSHHSEIGNLLDSLKVQLSRSRISKVISSKVNVQDFNYGWHNDESIFLNLRINIPIVSSEDHFIQIIKKDNGEDNKLNIEEFNLKPGSVYVYNTENNHRPFLKRYSEVDRINLILGVSPWISFNQKEKVWFSNEYYGKVHPFEMLREGLISNYF